MSELESAPEKTPQRADALVWLDMLTKIGAIFGVLFAIQQYLERRADARVERSLDYVSQYVEGNGAVAVAQREITYSLTSKAVILRRLAKDMEQRPEQANQARRRFILALVHGTDKTPGLLREHLILVNFFDALEVCVSAGICDEKTALQFFKSSATDHWQTFCSVIVESRDLDENWGTGLEAFVVRSEWEKPPGLAC